MGDTGVSQRELARLTGITEATLSRYVNGNRIPKATTLKKIADALGVGLDYFFTEEELKNSNEELNNSTDLVSRQAAIDAHCELCEDKGFCGDICPDVEVFRLIPTAQPEIIRCNACKHWTQTTGNMRGFGLGNCDYINAKFVNCNGFCYWAERRTDEPD